MYLDAAEWFFYFQGFNDYLSIALLQELADIELSVCGTLDSI